MSSAEHVSQKNKLLTAMMKKPPHEFAFDPKEGLLVRKQKIARKPGAVKGLKTTRTISTPKSQRKMTKKGKLCHCYQ